MPRDAKPYAKDLGYVLLIASIYLATQIIGGVAAGIYFGAAHSADPAALDAFLSQSLAFITAASAAVALSIYWIMVRVQGESLWELCQFEPVSAVSGGAALLLGAGLCLLLTSLIDLLQLHQMFAQHMEMIKQMALQPGLLASLLTMGIAIPTVEEVAFRGIVMNRMSRNFSAAVVILVQSAVFGAVHLNILQGSYAFFGGILLGLCYLWSGSLWTPILIHVGLNATSIFRVHLLAEPVSPAIMLTIALPLTLAGMHHFCKLRQAQNAEGQKKQLAD